MPKQAYVNTFQPNTAIGQSLNNLASAFFGAKQSQRDADITAQELAMKENYYGANAEQSRASARKAIAESLGLENQNTNMRTMPQAIQAGGGNSEQIAKALQQIAESEQYANAAKNPTLIPHFGKLQAASGGKALYDHGLNNTTFGLFDGAVQNEDNALNQAAIKYGNDGTEVGKSNISLNTAQQAKYYADAAKAKQDKKTGILAETYDSLTDTYKYVPKVDGAVIRKKDTSTDKRYAISMNNASDMGLQLDALNQDKEIDPQAKAAIISRASQIAQQTGNQPDALMMAMKELTGGQGLVGAPVRSTTLGISHGDVRPSDTKVTLPKKQAKQAAVKAKSGITKSEYDALPVGATYTSPDGITRTKGGA